MDPSSFDLLLKLGHCLWLLPQGDKKKAYSVLLKVGGVVCGLVDCFGYLECKFWSHIFWIASRMCLLATLRLVCSVISFVQTVGMWPLLGSALMLQ